MNDSGIASITVNGLAIQLRFGLPACREFSALILGDDSHRYMAGNMLNEFGIAKLFYFGYVNACMVRDEQPVLTYEDFYEVVEAKTFEDRTEIENAVKIFEASRSVVNIWQQVDKAVEETKKKLIGTRSKLSVTKNSDLRKKSFTQQHINTSSPGTKPNKQQKNVNGKGKSKKS